MSCHTDARIFVVFIKQPANVMAVQCDLEMVCSHQARVVVQMVVYKNTPLDNVVDCNQIFTRDLGFVADDIFVCSNIIPHREKELASLNSVLTQIPASKQLVFPKKGAQRRQ